MRGISWPNLDGFREWFKMMMQVHPEERRNLRLMAVPLFISTLVILGSCHIEDWGRKKVIGEITWADVAEVMAALLIIAATFLILFLIEE